MATAMSTPSLTSTITSNIKARGLAIIVTNDYSSSQDCLVKAKTRLPPLPGTLVDGVEMKATFESIGFAVYWGKNVGQERFFKIIHEARSYPSYRKLQYKCVIFVFSGHGDSGDILYLQDGYSLNITRDFIEPFLPDSAYNLGSLPKLFFIDACRGEKNMDTVLVPGDSVPRGKIAPAEVDESTYARGGKKIDIKSIPAKGGVLVAYSTVSDYRAWERQDKGGVWLQLLAQEIRSSHCSIDDVLTIVNKKLVSKVQTANTQQPEKISRLNDVLYLHPEKDSEGNYTNLRTYFRNLCYFCRYLSEEEANNCSCFSKSTCSCNSTTCDQLACNPFRQPSRKGPDKTFSTKTSESRPCTR